MLDSTKQSGLTGKAIVVLHTQSIVPTYDRYKRELIDREKEVENFLEKFYATRNPDFR